MKLRISKYLVKAGDIIEVKWDADEGTDPRLFLSTGNHDVSLSVPLNGSKRFKMKKSGLHHVKLLTEVYNKPHSTTRYFYVYGKMKDTDEFEYVDRGEASPIHQWNNGVANWWNSFSAEKKRLYILLLLLLGINMLGSIPSMHAMSTLLFYGTIFWLFWQIVKK